MEASSQRTGQIRLALILILGVGSVAACVAAFMWWKAPAASAQVVASPEAVFVTRCNYSHRNMDDPIVYPGQRGAAHSHDFFANRSTKYTSTTRVCGRLPAPPPPPSPVLLALIPMTSRPTGSLP
jgi:hypothetical protein